jgi:hypothetical protein
MSRRHVFSQARTDLLYAHERTTSLCAPFVAALPVSGASVSVLAGIGVQSTVCASDATAARLDELQFDLGEGPCWDALSTREPILHADLHTDGPGIWPLFANAVHENSSTGNVRALYAFPLFVGSLGIGAVDLYASTIAPLEAEQITDATELASLASWQVLRRILADNATDDLGGPSVNNRREVHQATGMVLAQLGISATDAALLLRAHAYSSGRSVAEVANDIVERRLDFATDGTL